MDSLSGKTALVTGATSGIGQAIAVHLAKLGCNVAINYRGDGLRPAFGHRERGEDTRALAVAAACDAEDACQLQTFLVPGDVSQEEDVIAKVAMVIEHFGGLDILVNNAGIQREAASHELSAADYDQIMTVNARGAFLCARQAIQHWLRVDQPGAIINVSSVHEVIPRPRYLSYAMSKAAMGALTKTLALEYAAHKIRVNAVAPGATVTPINQNWTDDPERQAVVESHIPMQRVGFVEDVAKAVAFLASDGAAYITGQTLYVDGGLTLYADFQTPWSA